MNDFLSNFIYVFVISGRYLMELAPYLIIGIILGELLKLTSWTKIIYKGVSHSPILSTLIASLLGMASPLCTYGTVPVVLQLYKAGVSIAPLVAFLTASGMMNPQLFMYTLGGIGLEMAIARTVAVFLFSIVVGFILLKLPAKWVINPRIQKEPETKEEILNRGFKKFEIKKFIIDVLKNLEFVGFYLVLGILLGSAIEVFVPRQLISALFAPGHWLSVLSAAILGVPLYACGGGAIGFINGLIQQGMSKGAVLTFFLVGPATRPTPLISLATILKTRFIIAYVGLLLIFSFILGLLYR